jgi:hypothetical protein
MVPGLRPTFNLLDLYSRIMYLFQSALANNGVLAPFLEHPWLRLLWGMVKVMWWLSSGMSLRSFGVQGPDRVDPDNRVIVPESLRRAKLATLNRA